MLKSRSIVRQGLQGRRLRRSHKDCNRSSSGPYLVSRLDFSASNIIPSSGTLMKEFGRNISSEFVSELARPEPSEGLHNQLANVNYQTGAVAEQTLSSGFQTPEVKIVEVWFVRQVLLGRVIIGISHLHVTRRSPKLRALTPYPLRCHYQA